MRGSNGGPCCHCGTSQTPCWRRGPPEKPTLCNACGSRYLVKGSLAGYFPGARRSAVNSTRSEVVSHRVVVTKGSRKAALPAAVGVKRKSHELDGFKDQAQRIYNEYEALEALRYAYFCRGPSFIGHGDGLGATVSDSSAEAHNDEDCFQKEAHYLEAFSDEYQEQGQETSIHHPLGATTATGVSGPQPAMFHRRPRKQLRPVACSC
ncbi:hypothetical protein Vafri_8155 [Volvox africanus]|nr:hypothetical protein Vafri_8155 [Volvox africanus]